MSTSTQILIALFFITLLGYFLLRIWISDLYRQAPPRHAKEIIHHDPDEGDDRARP